MNNICHVHDVISSVFSENLMVPLFLTRGRRCRPMSRSSSSDFQTDNQIPEVKQKRNNCFSGEQGTETEHGSSTDPAKAGADYEFREGEDDANALIPVDQYLESRHGEKPVGVFAVYDKKRNLQYISYSGNIVLSIRSIQTRVDEDLCAFIRVMVIANKAMQSQVTLEREAQRWINEAGTIPPGNAAERITWEGSNVESSGLFEDQGKKATLQRDGIGASYKRGESSNEEPPKKGPLGADAESISDRAPGSQEKVTPFARAAIHRSVGNVDKNEEAPEMTIDSVDQALDEVRPYLMADGGNVEVVSIDNGIVSLELQGACGNCPSSNATMKMGIERSLRAQFGEQLVDVVAVNGTTENEKASKEGVDMHLNMLRGAVAAYGGTIEVESVEDSIATLKYKGPLPIGYGIVAAVRDKFPDLVDVVMIDPETGNKIKF